jgi:hypothetical protein
MITRTQKIYEPIPTGRYPARINKIEEKLGQFGMQFQFEFLLKSDATGEEKTLLGWCGDTFSTKSKLYRWTQAAVFGGGAIPRDYEWNDQDMLGKKVMLVVVEKTTDDGSIVNKIDGVLPYVAQPAQPAQPPAPPSW